MTRNPRVQGPDPRPGGEVNFGTSPIRIVALAGGVGAARLLHGMVEAVDPSQISVIVNTGDDTVLHGMHVSPDIDTVVYTLAALSDPDRGWGLSGETWTANDRLRSLGGNAWFQLGDRDIATHMMRTDLLAAGRTLSEATVHLASAHGLGAPRIMPMTDDPVQTRVTLAGSGDEVGFQEYFVKLAHDVAVSQVRYAGAETAAPAPGVLDALRLADAIVICPSNPILSIAPILAVPAIGSAIQELRDRVVAISPLVRGRALKGPADRILRELGFEASAAGVASIYRDLAATFVLDNQDAPLADRVRELGVRPVLTDTIMTDAAAAAKLSLTAIDAVAAGRAA